MRSLDDIVSQYEFKHIRSDYVVSFGDDANGAIESIGIGKGPDELFEIGYYYYDDSRLKPIINISPMIGCPSKCIMCTLGHNEFKRVLTAEEMYEQIMLMLLHARRFVSIEKQHKVSVAKSGEPLLNPHLVSWLEMIGTLGFSIKVSTVFPKGERAQRTFEEVSEFARNYREPVQFQISLISTNERYRSKVTGGVGASFSEIRKSIELWFEYNPLPKGRKPNLSLILAEDTPADPREIFHVLPSDLVNIRLRNIIQTENAHLQSMRDEQLELIRKKFLDYGYTVSEWGRPPALARRFKLYNNSTLERYRKQVGID